MKIKKKVSVIVNFHNGEKYLETCIKSIVNQNYKNLEIILWDNNSFDKSKTIINKFNDNRIKYYKSKKKNSLYNSRNRAINLATGEFIAFLDCDDWWEKNYISSRKKYFLNEKFDFFYCGTNLVFEKSNKKKPYRNSRLPSGIIYDFLAKDYFLAISGIIFKKKIFLKYGLFNEKYNIIGDYDFLMKISKKLYAHYLDKPLLNYRVHENNFSRLNSAMFYREYRDWYNYNLKINEYEFKTNIVSFKNKLNYLELKYLLLNKKKSFYILKKILLHENFIEKIKLLILFGLNRKLYLLLRK